mgnify:CR=1 FL=1
MISFLKNTRRKLLAESKAAKYLIYALGEIFLVVVGILIAFQIENWREVQKQNELTEHLLDNVFIEIQRNFEETEEIVSECVKDLALTDRILDGELTKEDYLNDLGLKFAAKNFTFSELHSEAFDVLIKHSADVPKKYSPVIERLKLLYTSYQSRVHYTFEKLLKNIHDDAQYYKRNYEWYGAAGEDYREGFATYATTNPMYKNEMTQAALLLSDYIGTQSSYQYEAMICYQMIHQLRKKKTPLDPSLCRIRSASTAELSDYEGGYSAGEFAQNTNIRVNTDKLSAWNNSVYFVTKDTFLVSFGHQREVLFYRDEQDSIAGFIYKDKFGEQDYKLVDSDSVAVR